MKVKVTNQANLSKLISYLESLPDKRFNLGVELTNETEDNPALMCGCIEGHIRIIIERTDEDYDTGIAGEYIEDYLGVTPAEAEYIYLYKWSVQGVNGTRKDAIKYLKSLQS